MKSRHIYYIPLLALFIIAVTYQTRYAMDALREDLYAHELVREPFVMEELDPVITRLRPEAEEAGLRKGDWVLSVGDRPLTGAAVFDQLAATARPGDTLSVVVRRSAGEEGAAAGAARRARRPPESGCLTC
jgi:membrane-associated protease RseP (regulator of RpoE activity)